MTTYDFSDASHAEGYLAGSVIRIGNDPIYITRVRSARTAGYNLYYIPTTLYSERDDPQGVEQILFNDPTVNLSPVPLGMVNIEGDTIYLQRIPYRQWKIGLTPRNCYAYSYSNNDDNIMWRRYIRHMGFIHCVRNEYPTYEQVISDVVVNTDRYRPWVSAFSRNFAINRAGEVFYYILGDVPIGKVNQETNSIQLLDDRFYLQQLLEQDGARCV